MPRVSPNLIAADDGLIARPRLIRRLVEARRAHLALLTAPAGYSKSTSLDQWARVDDRPFAWIAATARHDDPAVMVASIVAALDEIEIGQVDVLAPLGGPNPIFETVVLPRLAEWFQRTERPFVLVIDDIDAIHSRETLAVIESAIESLPAGSQIAIASRAEPELPLGRIRARRKLVELGHRELAMTREESEELLRSFHLELTPDQVDKIFDRTEGWPAALYLAGLSLSDQKDLAAAVRSFAGDDRIVVDYLRDEFLALREASQVDFLIRTSILDRLTGPLCDAVVQRSGSGDALERMSRANALVIPVDRRGETYRYHHLFADMLRSELRRRHPEGVADLHACASHWYAEHGDADRAIEHAIAGRDTRWTGQLVWAALPQMLARGRIATLERWLADLGDETIASSPKLALSCAHLHLNLGRNDRAAHWARIAAASAETSRGGTESIEADLLLISAVLGSDGIGQVGRDASRASELVSPESEWQASCFFFRGVSSHLAGHPERARPLLEEAARRGAVAVPLIQSLALAQLALLALDDDDSEAALRLVAQARDQTARCGMSDYASVATVFAASARISAGAGMTERARSDVEATSRLLSVAVDMAPWFECEARIALAGACIRLDDLTMARALLHEAASFLERVPDEAILSEWLESAKASHASASKDREGVQPLTTAELRTLQYLPSHLSFREIGECIHISPNTVKTQARAVYRKLDASSRAEAVATARKAGLLGEDPLRAPSDGP